MPLNYTRNPLPTSLRWCAALVVLLLGWSTAAPLSHAQIFVDADATGADDGTSWTDAYTSLQDALDIASSADEIWIAAGTYYPDEGASVTDGDVTASFTVTGDQNSLDIYGGFAGTETSLRDRIPGNETILSGDIDQDDDPFAPQTDSDGDPNTPTQTDHINGSNSYHVLVFDGGDGIGPDVAANITSTTVLGAVTITAGLADQAEPDDAGAGLFCDGEGSGNECSPTIAGVTFSGNAAGSLALTRGDLDVGGALYNGGRRSGTSSPTIVNSAFFGNFAVRGGGAIVNDGDSDGTSSPTIVNSVFSDNHAGDGTGSGSGGAILNDGFNNGTSSPTLIGVTVSGNFAEFAGGALYNNGFRGTAKPQIINTIFWDNTAGRGNEVFSSERPTEVPVYSYSLIRGSRGSGTNWSTANFGIDGGNNIDADPLFVDATNAPGPDGLFGTPDDGLRLDTGSPAIDVGNAGALPVDTYDLDGDGDTGEALPFDAAGRPRQQEVPGLGSDTDFPVDIGAYEANGTPLPVELTAFTAQRDGQGALLTWTTASETNNAGFEVQQQASSTGASTWTALGFVEGVGTTAEAQTYRFAIGRLPVGTHRFRLKQVDTDGAFAYSEATSLDVTIAETYRLVAPRPNPTREGATLRLAVEQTQSVTVTIYDLLGREVATPFYDTLPAQTERAIRVGQGLSAGSYFIRIEGERFSATERVTVVR